MTKEIIRPRGRPRKFDVDEAVATAQCLFHSLGYDAVSVSDVTNALGINTPSFYSAFQSKAALYQRVINRYGSYGAVPFSDILRSERSVVECLTAMLEDAARRFAGDSAATGCIVLEGCRCCDEEARGFAHASYVVSVEIIRSYIAARHPEEAAELTEYISTVMIGLSAQARSGKTYDTLLQITHIASRAIAATLRE